MCSAHATVRGLMHGLMAQAATVVIDMEAGLEHLSRGTPRYVDILLLVAEPYFKSMQTAARCHTLAAELGIRRVAVVPNKLRGAQDEAAMRSFFGRLGLPLLGFVPADEQILEADRLGRSPVDHDAGSPAVVEIIKLAEALSPS